MAVIPNTGKTPNSNIIPIPKLKTNIINAFSGFTLIFIINITHGNKNYEIKKEGHAHVPPLHTILLGNAYISILFYIFIYYYQGSRIHHSMVRKLLSSTEQIFEKS